MIRIRGGVVIRLVAAVAVGWQRGVIVVYMATSAGHAGVKTSERKFRRVVIELAVGPDNRVVAKIASRGKPDLNMVNRRGRRVVGIQMAGHTCSVGARQTVIVVDVAVGADARGCCVRVRQRKSSRGVIELAVGPEDGVVAAFTRCGETQLNVVHGRGRGVVILQVT